MSDLAEVTPQPREISILSPADGEPTGLVIRLLPMTDSKVKAAQNRNITEARARRSTKISQDVIEENGTRILVAAVEGWEWKGEATFRGSKPEFNEANLRAVLKIEWIRKQIDIELGDEAAFFRRTE